MFSSKLYRVIGSGFGRRETRAAASADTQQPAKQTVSRSVLVLLWEAHHVLSACWSPSLSYSFLQDGTRQGSGMLSLEEDQTSSSRLSGDEAELRSMSELVGEAATKPFCLQCCDSDRKERHIF